MNKRPNRNGEVTPVKQNTLLVDGNSLFKTAFFASKNEYNKNGEHIGGILTFFTMLRKILVDDLYHRVYVFWDGNFSGKLRYELYSPYKSGRGKNYILGTQPDDLSELNQRKIVWEYLNEMYVRQMKDEIIESDDFIAYYCLNKKDNENITIVSSDRDFVQLMSDSIRLYLIDMKEYINLDNHSKYFNYHHKNSVLIKIMTGDNSDSIKGIKGLGQTKLISLFPELKEMEISINEIIELAKLKQSQRIEQKQKPLKVLDNIINKVTDGVQKELIYEINDKLVNLSKPMLTEDGKIELNKIINGSLNGSNRELKTVFKMMKENGIDKSLGDYRFNDFLIPFKKLIDREIKN